MEQPTRTLSSLRTLLRNGVGLVGLALLGSTCSAAGAIADDCQELAGIDLPDVTVESVAALEKPVAHCKLEGRVGPTIRFALLLPEDWNGGFVMGGGGGFVGSIDNQALSVGALASGYATAGTDTGHQARTQDGSWALHDLEAIVNYAHLAIHRVTEVSKEIIEDHYTREPSPSYFFGCSNGGRQALKEAQRYPDDFDAIVAGAPALDFGGIGASFTYVTQRMYPDSSNLDQPVLDKQERQLLRQAILERCDSKDDIEDGILMEPNSCDFDPQTLLCSDEGSSGCLEKEDLAAVDAIYGGPRTGSGEQLHPGFPFGAEDIDANGWGSWLVGAKNMMGAGVPNSAYGFGIGLMRYFVYQNASWDYEGYGFETWEEDSAAMQESLNANDPDLSAFREGGGKLLLFHGWSDAALTANATVDYVESVYQRDPSAKEDVRLFMLPGVLHCAGGKGPSRVDWLGALDQWHSTGKPPAELEATWTGGPEGRKVCAWPRKAVLVGDNDRSPASFECR